MRKKAKRPKRVRRVKTPSRKELIRLLNIGVQCYNATREATAGMTRLTQKDLDFRLD